MNNFKTTKRALLTSVLSMVLCFTMLLGTTFAWFTDSVTSENNIIKSGNLDIELEYWNGKEWVDVAGKSDILTNKLWEPGVTEVAYLRVANAGSLALKYQLGVNIVSEKAGKNAAGESFKLSDYIMFGVVEGINGEKGFANRDAAVEAVKEAKNISAGYTKAGSLVAGADPVYLALVVYMPTTVGNVANHDGKNVPQIDLGINIFATQYTFEEDSFGDDYDDDAPYSLWNGVVPTEMPASLVVDGATQTIHVQDADAFVYLSTLSAKWVELYTDGNGREWSNYANGAGADYYYSNKWTVSLEADIDLGNHSIDPVDIKLGEATGASAFNGNGHTIRNINTTTGLFADKALATFTNITLENVKATNGALIGSADHNISNVTVKNATISGVYYVGGVVGYSYGAVNGCKVIDSSITATGKEAGGLIGYVATSRSELTVAYNTVNNVNVYAGNRAAGLVAQVNDNVKVYNNVIDIVTVGAADTSKYQPGAVVSNAIVPENVYDNTVTNANVATKAANATDNVTLNSAIADGADTIFLGSGEYVIPDSAQGKTLTINGSKDTVLKVMNEGENGADYGFDGSTVTFNGVTVDTTANTGSYKGFARMKATFNDCTFIGGGFTTFSSTSFNNCTFDLAGYIWTWGANEVNFTECTFIGDSRTILAHGGASTVITIKDCDFAATSKGRTGSGDWTAAVEIDPTGTNTYTINFVGENSLNENYSGWTRIKDGSTGHTVTGLE